MRKRLTSALLALVLLLTLAPAMGTAAAAESYTGSGTAADPYVVTDYDGLRDVLMNQGSSQTTYLKLGADFDTKDKADGAGVTEATKIIIRNFFVLDLNGHKAELYSLKINHLIRVIYGGLTVWDSSAGQTGELQGSGDVDYFILLDYGKFTLSSGTVSVNLNDYRWRSVIRTTKTGQAKVTINGGSLNIEAKGRFCGTENGHGFEPQDYALYIDEGDSAEINGGTFNGRVLFCGKTVAPSDTTKKLIVNGGNFKRSVYLDIEDGAENETVTPVEINGGVFEYDVEGRMRSYPTHYDVWYYTQFSGMDGRAVFKPGTVIYAQGNSRSEGDMWAVVTEDNAKKIYNELCDRTDYGELTRIYKSPITVIPNAYGIKDVTLNGAPIQYTHNSPYATVYDVKRSEANTLTFSWYDLPEEMKSAGYSYSYSYRLYRNNVETVTGGTVTPTTAGGVSTWTHPVPADSAMNSYVVYLRLDLMKDGALVNAASYDEYIVRLSGTDSIVNITETTLSLPGGDLRPDHYYGKPRESNTASVSKGVKYTISSQTDWAGTLGDDYHFKAGNEYTKTVILKANTGYQFTASCTAALTGAPSAKITSAVVSADKKTMTVQLQATCVTVLRTASGTLTGFYQGMDVRDAKVISAEPEKYDIEIAYIKAKDTAGDYWEHSVFDASSVYIFGLKVVPKPGYGFLETGVGTVNLTVNVNEEYGYTSRTLTGKYTKDPSFGNYSSGYIGVFFQTEPDDKCFPPPQTFDRVNVSIKVPVAGDSADDIAYKKAFVDQPGFTVTDFYWEKKGTSGKFTGTFQSGETYTYNITVECPWYMEPVKNSYGNANDSVYVNGTDAYRYLDETTSPGKLLIVAIDDMTATGTAPGVSIIGTVESYGNKADPIKVQLIRKSTGAIEQERVLTGETGTGLSFQHYSLTDIGEGEYILRVTKKNHATYETLLNIKAEDPDRSSYVKLYLLGDVNGDGSVTGADRAMVLRHIKGTAELTGYEFACADVTGDGAVTGSDSTKILRHVKGIASLWT